MLPGIARLPFGFRSPPPDHRRSGRQSHRPWPLSGAKPRSTDRRRNAGTHWQATLKPLPLAVFLPYSPTIGRLPRLPPSAISGSDVESGDRLRGAQQTSSSIRDSYCQRSLEFRRQAPSSHASFGGPPSARPALGAGFDRVGTRTRILGSPPRKSG